jgi:uncharacterized protein YuzB (UPF0349 family)
MTKAIEDKTIDGQTATSIQIWQTFNSMETDPEIGGYALIQYTILNSTGSCITTGYIRIDGEAYTTWTGEYTYAAGYIATELNIVFLPE